MNNKDTYPENDLILFFLGPLFLILIKLTGKYNFNYRTHYNPKEKDKTLGRKLTLMVLGTIFYVVVFILFSEYRSK